MRSPIILFLGILITASLTYIIILWTSSNSSPFNANATSSLGIETESGVITGNVGIVSDPLASGGKYTQFQSVLATKYVSPNGNDSNLGTQASPWKSMYKAAGAAKAGDIVLFEDGTYNETRPTLVANTGTSDSPIIFRSKNKHLAKIIYQNLPEEWKFTVIGKHYVYLENFEITQTTISNGVSGMDKIVEYIDATNGRITGNKIHHAYEDLIKIQYASKILVDGNILYDSRREAIDTISVNDIILSNNEIRDISNVGFMLKAGSRNIQVYNNYIHQSIIPPWLTAIDLGGLGEAEFAYDPSGYENYHSVAFNNIIVSEAPGAIPEGIAMSGCDSCAAYNNVIIGTNVPFIVRTSYGDKARGWTWDSMSRNPVFKNNIAMNCTSWMNDFDPVQGSITFDYNLIYNCPGATSIPQVHGVYSNPLFVNAISDWHLQSSSPAKSKGETIPSFIPFFDQNTPSQPAISVSFTKDNLPRQIPWNMGIY